jgi:hypothetical protein
MPDLPPVNRYILCTPGSKEEDICGQVSIVGHHLGWRHTGNSASAGIIALQPGIAGMDAIHPSG